MKSGMHCWKERGENTPMVDPVTFAMEYPHGAGSCVVNVIQICNNIQERKQNHFPGLNSFHIPVSQRDLLGGVSPSTDQSKNAGLTSPRTQQAKGMLSGALWD